MNFPISRAIIGCYKGDYWLARCCIASVRRWAPDLPITLLKDVTYHKFDTSDAERHWNVDTVCVVGYGSPASKFEAFRSGTDRFLFLDADIVLVGDVFERLNQVVADFVVCGFNVGRDDDEHVRQLYYDVDLLREKLDPDFSKPNYVFNAGQFVANASEELYDKFLSFYEQSQYGNWHLKYPEEIRMNDQGVLNYCLTKMEMQEGRTVGKCDFKIGPKEPRILDLNCHECTEGEGVPYVIHWMGEKGDDIIDFTRSDILDYYHRLFYSKIPGGDLARDRDRHESERYKKRLKFLKNIYRRFPVRLKALLGRFR